MADIIILVFIGAGLLAAVLYYIRQKKSGQSGCGCGCDGCSQSRSCKKTGDGE